MTKTVQVEGVEYALETMTAGQALDIQDKFSGSEPDAKTTSRWSFEVVSASLPGKSRDEALKIPWTHYKQLIEPALEVNGFKTASDTPGEAQAGESPAA